VLGFFAAVLVLPVINPLEAALIAALLAPTDAALGVPVVTNKAVPPAIREALNLESGLNDGICVPVVIVLLDFAIGREIQGSTLRHVLVVAVEELGIGLLAGLLLTGLATATLRIATRFDWTSEHGRGIPGVALAALCFTAAQALGGAGCCSVSFGRVRKTIRWEAPPARARFWCC
jgi:NhaP-type Na+/H+ or K+/H+ antiporter